MKHIFRKSAIAVLSAAVLSCSGAAAGLFNSVSAETLVKNASQVMTVSEGLTATYNVSGSEKSAYLTQDTKKGIHFSAKQNGNAAEGNSVTFNNTLSGLFELDFRVYTQNTGTSDRNKGDDWYVYNDAEEIREVAITLTDTDANKSFTIYVEGGTSWRQDLPNARVAYGDVGANRGTGIKYGWSGDNFDYDNTTTPLSDGWLSNSTFNTGICGTTFTNVRGLHSTVVGFDPITKEVYSYNFDSTDKVANYAKLINRRVILDLDNLDHLSYAGTGASALTSCSFDNYTVKFTLTDVTGASEKGSQGKDEPANFLIYSLNGQSLGGANGDITSTAAAGLSAAFTETAQQYAAYTLPTPTLRGVLGETPAFAGKVKVIAPDNSVALSERAFTAGLNFTPSQSGEYTVVYSGVKGADGSVKKALAKDHTYSGSEVVYSYPLKVEKALNVTANAQEIMTVEGFDVTYNVAGNQMHGDLTRDENKGIYFVSKQTGANAKGSITFKNTLTGLFELNFRAFTNVTDTSTDYHMGGKWYERANSEELREIAITITDSDSGEKFTVYIKGGTEWNATTPNARVAYGDAGEYYGTGYWYDSNANGLGYYPKNNGAKGLGSTSYNTEIVGTSFANRARNAGGFIGGGYSTNIGFDPTTKQVYAYTYGDTQKWECTRRPILDLDDAEDMPYLTMNEKGSLGSGVSTAFANSTFENYTVKVTVTDVTEGEKAQFILYHLNGQSLGGKNGALKSDSGYGYYLPESQTQFAGIPMQLPMPTAGAVLTGAKTFDGDVEIVAPNGEIVLPRQAYSSGMQFTPQMVGTYTVYYGGMQDSNEYLRAQYHCGGYTGEEERLAYTFVSVVSEIALTIPSYDYVMKNMPVEIGATPYDNRFEVYLTVQKNGQVYDGMDGVKIANNYSYAFADNGEYQLLYSAKDTFGNQTTITTTVRVVAMTAFIIEPETLAVLGRDTLLDKKDFAVYYCNEGAITDYTLSVEVNDGSKWNSVTVKDGAVNLKDEFVKLGVGTYNVRFTFSKNGESVSVERAFEVKDCTPPQIVAGELGAGFVFVPETSDEQMKYYVVLKDTQTIPPVATATDDADKSLAVEILWKKPSDSVAAVVTAQTDLVFDEVGVYLLVYKAVDSVGNESNVIYSIETKSLWLTFEAEDVEVELGESFTPAALVVKNGFTGELVQDATWTTTLTLNGVETDTVDDAFLPTYVGEYTLTYEITYQGDVRQYSIAVTVVDTQAPVVEVDGGYAKTAQLGSTITVKDAIITDASSYTVVVSVTLNGTVKIDVDEENTFKADKAGKYVIRYTATDLSGNVTYEEFTITVSEPSTSGCAGRTNFEWLAVLALGFAVVTVCRKRQLKNEKRGK